MPDTGAQLTHGRDTRSAGIENTIAPIPSFANARPDEGTRSNYRLDAGIIGRLRQERRALIEAADVELVELDGRVWQLRRLPSAMSE
jgi:hypothetical protein